MIKLSEQEFDRVVRRAVKRIPAEIREHMVNVLISVRKRPSREMLRQMGIPPGDSPLGLYTGASLAERSETYPPLYPDTILIFQEPLEEMCDTKEELEEQIEITVVHEIAHFIGMDEATLHDLGYG